LSKYDSVSTIPEYADQFADRQTITLQTVCRPLQTDCRPIADQSATMQTMR